MNQQVFMTEFLLAEIEQCMYCGSYFNALIPKQNNLTVYFYISRLCAPDPENKKTSNTSMQSYSLFIHSLCKMRQLEANSKRQLSLLLKFITIMHS